MRLDLSKHLVPSSFFQVTISSEAVVRRVEENLTVTTINFYYIY